ncbi:MAG: DUF3820 family protein [Pirellulaceae bacterium]|nr:DUF3820 family protein [Pirellulaceae bacterium]
MSDEEAREFEKTGIPFGAHKGKQFKDVPIEYLCWLADSTLKLQSYLRSPIGEKRKESES